MNTNPDSLGRQQEQLVRALVAGGPIPPGFDRSAVRATASALLRKRADLVAAQYPWLPPACGPDFTERFRAWADSRPTVSTTDDATGFARHAGIAWLKPSLARRARRLLLRGR